MSTHHGKELDWRVENWSCDEVGAVTIELVKSWDGLLTPQTGSVPVPEVPRPPTMPGYTRGGGSWKRLSNGGRAISFTFKGVDEEQATGPNGEPRVVWSMSPGLYQRFIKTHPNWPLLKSKYGWDDDKKEFPETMPNGIGLESFTYWRLPTAEKPNPLRGVTGFDDWTGTITKTWLARNLSSFDRVKPNQIVKVPWPLFGPLPEERDWKSMLPSVQQQGDYLRISQAFEASGPGGWNKDMYKERGK